MQKYKVGDKVRLKSDHRISDVRRLETQAECDKRIEKDAKLDGIRKVRRRELFEDLKREFDG